MREAPPVRSRRLLPTALLGTAALLVLLTLASLAPVAAGPSAPPHTLPARTFALAPPAGAKGIDDLAQLGISYGHHFVSLLWAAYQNGVGATGTASSSGAYRSTIAGYVLTNGTLAREVNVTGKVDGLAGDRVNDLLIATVNEDANSSLYAINPQTLAVTHFVYSSNLSVGGNGGSDSVTVWNGYIVIDHSNPNDTREATAYRVVLNWTTGIANVRPIFWDDSAAHWGSPNGTVAPLALTDPDTNYVMPRHAGLYGGDLVEVSQGDGKVIFAQPAGHGHYLLTALNLTDNVSGNVPPIDGFAVANSGRGTLYAVDNIAGTITAYTTNGWPTGTVFVGEPTDNGNPLLGTLNLSTGIITPLGNHLADPKGLWFVPG